jgi:glutamate N-acetyltransferase/amino-acid N-acetyltransferase
LALIVSDTPSRASALFTRNRFPAAPVIVSRRHGRDDVRAIVASSGNANACTGERGERDALTMCEITARSIGSAVSEVFVCSTGVIGVPLPIEKIAWGIPRAAEALSPTGWEDAADAIRTTDAFRKMAGCHWSVGGHDVRLIGVAKGAGMIQPNLATMLAFLATDAAVEPALLDSVLRAAVRDTFNSISVDGDTSTNDTLILLANGQAGGDPIAPGTEAAEQFEAAVRRVCGELARMMVRDGEGATKLVTLEVRGARSDDEARQAARAVANSLLVKMTFLGEDANWGRFAAALGNAGVEVCPESCSVGFEGMWVLDRGHPVAADQVAVEALLKKPEFTVEMDLGTGGTGRATFWTCDISDEYVRFNAHYRT